MLRVHQVGLPGALTTGIPSAVAVEKVGESILVGQSALDAPPDAYDLLLNWKLFLGKNSSALMKQRAEDTSIGRILEKYSPEDIATAFFREVLKRIIASTTAAEKPTVIVGIPVIMDGTTQWRSRYKKTVENAFKRSNLPAPRFFPEPFAVFQYHWNRQAFPDIGRHQNVFVIDIGGGTTNVCFIQTTHHGRLARGGTNHVPHAVRSIELGGSNLDRFILDRFLPSSLHQYSDWPMLAAADAKERLSARIGTVEAWQDQLQISRTAEEVKVSATRRHTLTGADLRAIVESRLWPTIAATVRESVEEIKQTKLSHLTEPCDAVIFAGGTCQLALIELLFRENLGKDSFFAEARYLRNQNFASAVSGGLAIEACANSRLHEIRPTRVAPYIQDDILFHASHRRDAMGPPRKLKARTAELSNNLKQGIILSAPQGIIPLMDRKIQWSFSLAQKPREVFLQFNKIDSFGRSTTNGYPRPIERVKLAKASDASPDALLSLIVKSDGFADVQLQVTSNPEGAVVYNAGELDLHDLSGMEGSLFYGLDFGTSSTLASFINLDDPTELQSLPEQYTVSSEVTRRVESLEDRVRELLTQLPKAQDYLVSLNDQIIVDYVYHSNRIEGSLLNRGQTVDVLGDLPETRAQNAVAAVAGIAKLGYINDLGEVVAITRPIQDAVAAINLRDAFVLVREWASDAEFLLSSFYLRQLHSLVTRGDDGSRPGEFRNTPVRIEQTSFVPPDALQVPDLVEDMFKDIACGEFAATRPLVQAAKIHARFVSIHPFADGNGRIARLLVNYFLWRANLPGVLLPWENRDRYYDALEECNSRELTNRGDLSDLTMLFCDLFEDAVLNLEDVTQTSADLDAPIVASIDRGESRMTNLLSRLTKQKSALNLEDQYTSWSAAQEAILAGVRQSVEELSRVFRSAWGGEVDFQQFPLIDVETYKAIRQRRRFSRTWFFRTRLSFPNYVADLVFFFGPTSADVRALDPRLDVGISLHGAKFDAPSARYVAFRNEQWSRVKEIVHNGSESGVYIQERGAMPAIDFGDEARVENWFAAIVEDVIEQLSQVDLAALESGAV
jgi:Fic family protein/actin-like ATPase involved in cell morphogenesis